MYVFVVLIVVKQVYLASMGVKIEHIVGGQNQDLFSWCISDGHDSRNKGLSHSKTCEIYLCFCSSKFNGIHRKLNKIEFCWKLCRVCH